MNYDEMESIRNEKLTYPESSAAEFRIVVKQTIDDFEVDNRVLISVRENKFQIADYHNLLLGLFHQVATSSTSFAIAGGQIDEIDCLAKEYLFHHAEEEMTTEKAEEAETEEITENKMNVQMCLCADVPMK